MTENSKENESSDWKRPPGPLNVWKIIDGKRNNESAKFTIQEIPVNRYEDVLDHMCEYFLEEEPGAACLRIKYDPVAIEDQKLVWRWVLEQGVSIGIFTDNPNGAKPILVGANILFVLTHNSTQKFAEIMKNLKSPIFIKFIMTMKQVTDEVDIKSKLGTEECLFAFGLSVMPSFRGQSFGGKMLDVRRDICQKYGLKATATIFTSPVSIKLAERLGFEVLLERDYDKILDEAKNPLFPNCTSKQFKYMSKKYC